MEINELREKFDDLKKRLTSLETKITIANTKKETIVTRLKDEFGIKPDEIKSTLVKMKESIDIKKQTLIEQYKTLQAIFNVY